MVATISIVITIIIIILIIITIVSTILIYWKAISNSLEFKF